jgi:hypothetical protein
MVVAGLRFDTVARAQTGTRWSTTLEPSVAGYTIRHPPGF